MPPDCRPLHGALDDALAAVHEALGAGGPPHPTATLSPEQRLEAVQRLSRARCAADAVRLLVQHTGASPERAGTELALPAALAAPPLTRHHPLRTTARAALDHAWTPHPSDLAPVVPDDGSGQDRDEQDGRQPVPVPVRDQRTASQRRADGLADLLAAGLSRC